MQPCQQCSPHCLKKAVNFTCPECGKPTCDQCRVRWGRRGERKYTCRNCAVSLKKYGQQAKTRLPLGAVERMAGRVAERELGIWGFDRRTRAAQ